MEKENCIEKPCFAELLAGIIYVSRSLGETDLETNLKESAPRKRNNIRHAGKEKLGE